MQHPVHTLTCGLEFRQSYSTVSSSATPARNADHRMVSERMNSELEARASQGVLWHGLEYRESRDGSMNRILSRHRIGSMIAKIATIARIAAIPDAMFAGRKKTGVRPHPG
jgi:hypothetical protein